jgi:hypothetical protein
MQSILINLEYQLTTIQVMIIQITLLAIQKTYELKENL